MRLRKDKGNEINIFKEEHKDLLDRIKDARSHDCAHFDPDGNLKPFKISFDEYEECILFLNKLLNFDFKNLCKNLLIPE